MKNKLIITTILLLIILTGCTQFKVRQSIHGCEAYENHVVVRGETASLVSLTGSLEKCCCCVPVGDEIHTMCICDCENDIEEVLFR